MYNWVKGIFLSAVIVVGFNACSSSQSSVSTGNDGIGPDWYSSSGFGSDSLSFHGYATAIASDSIVAVANAELQARANLESALAQKLEEVREAMEEEGSSLATDASFLISLRNAHQPVESAAKETAGEAVSKQDHFRGYSRVSISRTDLMKLLEQGFSGKNAYWKALSGSQAFSEELRSN